MTTSELTPSMGGGGNRNEGPRPTAGDDDNYESEAQRIRRTIEAIHRQRYGSDHPAYMGGAPESAGKTVHRKIEIAPVSGGLALEAYILGEQGFN